MTAKHPARDLTSEPVTEADSSPRAPGATDSTPSLRYIALLRGVAGVTAALMIGAVVAATLTSAPWKLSSLRVGVTELGDATIQIQIRPQDGAETEEQ